MQNPELKEVLPYIPYGVKAQDEHGNLRTVTIEHQTYDQNTVGINHVLCNGLFFKRHTLVLRTWSDLTKEIEVNGEKFVPLFELLKMAVNEKDYNEGCFNSEILHGFNVLGNFSVEAFYSKCRFVFIYYKDSMTFSLFEPQGVDLHCGFKYMQKLIEWHFDIFDQQKKQ